MRILVAENDPALGTILQRSFEEEKYAVELTDDGEQAERMVADREFDAAILDLNLACPDGLEVLRHVRARRPGLPLLVLTNQTRPKERAEALDLGADDLVPKPFAFSELSARVRALLRRGASVDAVLRVEDLELSRLEHKVRRASRTIELTPKEFSLLEFLMRHAGERVTRAQIIEHVWNMSVDTMTNVVDVYINYSSSQVDKRKVAQLAMAIQTAFQQMGVFKAGNTKPAVLSAEAAPLPDILEGEDNPQSAKVPDGPNLERIQRQLLVALAPEIKRHTVSITPAREGIVVSLREIGFFDSGSALLRPEAMPALAKFVKVTGPVHVRIRIEGHTDNVPIHNRKFDSNWDLSTARATEIIKLFVTKFGMAPERLSASGYGEYHPVAPNRTAEGRALNRRVDLVILGATPHSNPPVASTDPARPPRSPQN